MFSAVLQFINILLAALVVGAMFGVYLVFNPAGLDAKAYVSLQQQAIRALNKPMPRLGAATILATVLAAVAGRADAIRLALLITAALCFVVAGLVTRFLNQPINAVVMTWRSDAPPTEWKEQRDAWWKWHSVRLVTGLVGLCLLIAATLKQN